MSKLYGRWGHSPKAELYRLLGKLELGCLEDNETLHDVINQIEDVLSHSIVVAKSAIDAHAPFKEKDIQRSSEEEVHYERNLNLTSTVIVQKKDLIYYPLDKLATEMLNQLCYYIESDNFQRGIENE